MAGGHRNYEEIDAVHTDIFAATGVDLYVAGHKHFYSRALNPLNGTTYVIVGGAGCDEMSDGETEPGWHPKMPSWEYYEYSTGLLTANSTGLHWALIDSRNGSIVDQATVAKR